MPITEEYKVGEYIDLITGRRTNIDLISRVYAIVFHKPIFAKRIKIVLKKPFFTDHFGIEKVKFFQKRSFVIVKNEMLDYCQNYCFFMNTNVPRQDFPLEAYPCVEILNLSDNRELFINYNDRSLRLANDQGRCVGFNGARELVLKTCNDYEPSYAVDFKTDNTIYFEGYQHECIYIDGSNSYSNNFIRDDTHINVTSEGDLQTYKKENMKIFGSNFWSSTPSEKKVSIQILFGKFKRIENDTWDYEVKKVDVIRIEWNIHPKKFKVFTWTKGGIWILKKEFKNYNHKHTEINLVGEQMSAVMITMEEGHLQKDLGNRVVYSITTMYIGTKSYKLKTGDCKNIAEKFKIFDFDNQAYRKVDQTPPYWQCKVRLSSDVAKLRQKYLIILKDKMFIPQAEQKGIAMRKLLIDTIKMLKLKILERIQEFRFTYLNKIRNTEFDRILNMKNIKYMLFPDEHVSLQIGTYDFPAPDCLAVKKAKKSALSGWYYIKPECAKKPLRVFCDFSILGDAVDFYVYNDENDVPNPDLGYLEIRNVRDIRYHCAKHGLYPLKLQNKDSVIRLEQILRIMNYDLNMAQAIPLGYDYNCDQGHCSGLYRSLDDRSSNPINSFFESNGNQGANLEKKGHFAGLGHSNKREMKTYDFNTGARIGALICSTNHIRTDLSDSLDKKISCQTAVAGQGELFPPNNDVVVVCPMDCDIFPGPVYGDGIYHSNSSVCKAAIHAGVLSKKGGKLHVRVASPRKEYKQNKKNNISSSEYYIDDGLPSFSVEKYVPSCPLDFFKNDPHYQVDDDEESGDSSFIQKEEFYTLRDRYINGHKNPKFAFLQDEFPNMSNAMPKPPGLPKMPTLPGVPGQPKLPDLNAMTNSAMNNVNNAMGQGVNAIKDMAQNAADEANNIKSKVGDFLDESKRMAADATNNAVDSVNAGINNIFGRQNPGDPSPPGLAKDKEADKIKQTSTKCTPNTDLGKKILRSRREQADWEDFEEIKKKNKVIAQAIEVFNKMLAWSKKASKISNYRIKLLYVNADRFRQKLLKYIRKVYRKAMGRIFRTKNILRMFEEQYYVLCERDDYILSYNNKEELFKKELLIFDFLNGQNLKSDWDITTADINNRPRAIGLSRNLLKPNKLAASFIYLIHKHYYDFDLSIDILFKNIGRAGIAFRYQDPYNYYALFINRQKGFKEVVKVINGEIHVIQKIDDGGILINSWHTVRVKVEANRFHIFIYDAEQVARANSEKVIEFEDSDLASGSVAAYINDTSHFFIDALRIKSINCWTPWQPKVDVTLITNSANSFTETFKGSFDLNYELIDQPDSKDGPSNWRMVTKQTETEDLSIVQDTTIYDPSSLRIPAMAVLKDRYLQDGILRVEFVPLTDNGVISVIFKYNSQKTDYGTTTSFYVFDFTNNGDGSEENQCILRRVDNGLSKELKSITGARDIENPPTGFVCGYRQNVPHLLQLEVSGMVIKASLSINSRPFIKLFEVTDDTIKIGRVGFGTYHAKAQFITIETRPPKFIVSGAMAKDYIKNGKDEVLLNPYSLSTDDDNGDGNGGDGNGGGSGNVNRNNFKNGNDALWRSCVRLTTTLSRNQYCDERFKNEYQKEKCKASFCDTCCSANIFWVHTNTLHTCKKQCYRNTEETNVDTNYQSTCLTSEDPDKNIYSYCETKFTNRHTQKTCKYDMCNLCCVNLNTLKQKKHAFETVKSCFNDCSKKFYSYPEPK